MMLDQRISLKLWAKVMTMQIGWRFATDGFPSGVNHCSSQYRMVLTRIPAPERYRAPDRAEQNPLECPQEQ
ncbi:MULTISPECIES: hypothetical protein [unclassified Endozoicomonas]|uniref:hypothetical protein n=1 Tax=unclassified Endozoicomonas TaxID=2644528 RepID=UPI003BB756AB